MTKHLLHICECYVSFQLWLENWKLLLLALELFRFFCVEVANSTSETKEQGMWLWDMSLLNHLKNSKSLPILSLGFTHEFFWFSNCYMVKRLPRLKSMYFSVEGFSHCTKIDINYKLKPDQCLCFYICGKLIIKLVWDNSV